MVLTSSTGLTDPSVRPQRTFTITFTEDSNGYRCWFGATPKKVKGREIVGGGFSIRAAFEMLMERVHETYLDGVVDEIMEASR